MNHSQRVRMAGRERGRRRVGQVTRWTAAIGGLSVAVIGVVLAQGGAAASTTTAPDDVPPGSGSSGVLPQAPQLESPGGQDLAPPTVAPRRSHGGGAQTRSGGS